MDIISIFEELVKIPSPSLHEEEVSKKIMEYTLIYQQESRLLLLSQSLYIII